MPKFGNVHLVVILRGVEQVVALVFQVGGPLRAAKDVIGIVLQCRVEVRQRRANAEPVATRVEAEFFGLLHDGNAFGEVTTVQEKIGVFAFGFRQRRP